MNPNPKLLKEKAAQLLQMMKNHQTPIQAVFGLLEEIWNMGYNQGFDEALPIIPEGAGGVVNEEV